MTDKLVSVADIRRAVERECDMQKLYLPIHFLELVEDLPAREQHVAKVIQNGKNCKSFENQGGTITINM